MVVRLFYFVIITLSFVSCGRNKEQDRFEREAMRTPQGFTQTDASGRITQNDPDDWRIAPMFQGFIEVVSPAYPNPTSGSRVTVEFLVSGIESVFGLAVYSRTELGELLFITEEPQFPLPTGIIQIYIEPSWLHISRILSNAGGLNRIFVYDKNGNMITYGDIMVNL